MSRRFRILTIVVFATGIAAALAAVGASLWAWETPGTLLVFQIALPLLTAWMLVALVRLALALRRGDESEGNNWRAARPDAELCRRIELPAEPGTRWWQSRRRRRLALQFSLPDGCRHYVVGPAALVTRRHLVDRGRADRAGRDACHIDDDKTWLRKARAQVRWLGRG